MHIYSIKPVQHILDIVDAVQHILDIVDAVQHTLDIVDAVRHILDIVDAVQHTLDIVDVVQHTLDIVDAVQHILDIVDTVQHILDIVDAVQHILYIIRLDFVNNYEGIVGVPHHEADHTLADTFFSNSATGNLTLGTKSVLPVFRPAKHTFRQKYKKSAQSKNVCAEKYSY